MGLADGAVRTNNNNRFHDRFRADRKARRSIFWSFFRRPRTRLLGAAALVGLVLVVWNFASTSAVLGPNASDDDAAGVLPGIMHPEAKSKLDGKSVDIKPEETPTTTTSATKSSWTKKRSRYAHRPARRVKMSRESTTLPWETLEAQRVPSFSSLSLPRFSTPSDRASSRGCTCRT